MFIEEIGASGQQEENHMAYVYILRNTRNGHFYVGSTENIKQRLLTHQSGGVKATKNLLPVEIALMQEYPDMRIAQKIERRLKSLKRRDYIEKIIKDGKIRVLGD